MPTQAHIHAIGDVTKVGFRAWMRREAHRLNITGWARNVYHKPDVFGPHGGVEMLIQGAGPAVNDMLDIIRKGSPLSRIDDVGVRFGEPTETFQEFVVLKSEAFNHNL